MSATGFVRLSGRLPMVGRAVSGGILILVLTGASARAQTTVSSLALEKSGVLDTGSDGIAHAGDLIEYTLELVNQDLDECDITDLSITDPLLPSISCPSGNPISLLANGLSETCTGSYALTQADIDSGAVYNTASASGFACTEVLVEAMDDHLQPIEQVGELGLTKTGTLDVGVDGVANPGDVISYMLTATNSGSVTLTGVTVSDPSLADLACTGGNPVASLAPQATMSCTGSYTLAQADVDAGVKVNEATVSGDDSVDTTGDEATRLVVNAVAQVQVMIPQQPAIQIVKSGTLDLGANGQVDPGDPVQYALVVSNSGNVTLTGVAVTDPLVTTVTCPSGNPIPVLAPGAMETCTADYALTAADIAAGSVANAATATGAPPNAPPVSGADSYMLPLPPAMPTTGAWGLLALAAILAAAGALALRGKGASR